MPCCLEPVKQHCIEFWPVQCCLKCIKAKLHRTVFHAMLSGAYRTTLHSIYFDLCNVIPRVLRQHWAEFFLMQCCLEPLREYCIGFSAVNCCPTSIKTTLHAIFSDAMLSGAFRATLHWFFLIQSCLEPLRQHCIEFWPVQCFPKSIKNTLNRIFF